MKLFSILLYLSAVTAWKVDRRCLEKGQLLVGDEVDELNGYEFENNNGYDDEQFLGLDDLSILGLEEDKVTTNLRGSNSTFPLQDQTFSYSNTTRNLQSGKEFNLKLYWRRGYCWQDEWIERKWCMECRRSCNSGDVLEIQKCKRTDRQRFEWQNGRIKVANKNMCLTRSGNSLRLRSCGQGNQRFRGYQSSGGFEIKPEGNSKCLSQHHHPKAGEIIELENCGLAAQHNTNKWNVYWPSGGGGGGNNNDDDDDDDDKDRNGNDDGGGSGPSLTKKRGDCSSNDKCGRCEGDCDSDRDCEGNLQCRQRYGKSALDPVPGCSGTGKKGVDYCY